jgi:CO/xanthine dehydrogenase FAD-binding subunit
VKPAPFEWYRAESATEALSLLAQYGEDAKPLAGGQSLIPAMNFRLARPAVLVDLNRAADLAGIEPTPSGGVRIGAMTRQQTIERSETIARRAPLLAETMPWVAHAQIRTRGTIGGSVAHADPAAELPAVFAAIGARYLLRSGTGERWVDAESFATGLFATDLHSGELLVSIELPPPQPGTGFAFIEMARRHGDFALAGVACSITMDRSGHCSDARVALFGIGDGPMLSEAASGTLIGAMPDDAVIREASASVESEVDPPSDIHATAAFRKHLSVVLTRRALTRAAERARGPT